MNKKNILFFIAVLIIVALAAGCSATSPESKGGMMGSNQDMMKMINQDPDKMADAMSASDTRKSMAKIMSSDKMRPAMQDMMANSDVQKNMVKVMSDPKMKQPMINVLADPAMKQQLLTILKDPKLKPIAQEAAK